MVITYWEMVASFIVEGVLNEHLFAQSGLELLLVFERVRPILGAMRESSRNASMWRNLEIVALRLAAHLDRTGGAGAAAAFAERTKALR
jgi:hypothetical protein